MQRVKTSRVYQTPTAITSRRNLLLGCHALQQEVDELKKTLSQEQASSPCQHNSVMQLQQELEETKKEWQRQKTLKEMFINREKETRRELERLIKYSDQETLSTGRMASLARETARQKKKKALHVDYEELQVAHLISQEKFSVELQTEMEKSKRLQGEQERLQVSLSENNQRLETELKSVRQQADNVQHELDKQIKQKDILLKYYEELQATFKRSQETFAAELQVERERSKLLQAELERVKVLYKEDCLKYETKLSKAKQQADTLQHELQQEVQQKTLLQSQLVKEVESHAATTTNSCHVINDLKAEQEALSQKMTKERNVLQQNISERERLFERQMGGLLTKFNEQISLNLELSTELEAERDDRPPRKISRRKETREDKPLPNAPAMEPLKHAKVSEEVPCIQLESTTDAPALEIQEEAEISEENLPETTTRPSVWRRTRHLLGLRKPEKWKRNKE